MTLLPYFGKLDTWVQALGLVESIATVVALIIGGVWSYLAFVRNRLKFPRMELCPKITSVEIAPGIVLVHVAVVAKNIGSILFAPRSAEIRLRQVVPAPKEVVESAEAGWDPVKKGETAIEWPALACHEWQWNDGDLEIEPGESEHLTADFFVQDTVVVVQLYFHLQNSLKRESGLGWTLISLQAIEGEKGMSKENMKAGGGYEKLQQKPAKQQQPMQGKGPVTEQQRPKPPQKPQQSKKG